MTRHPEVVRPEVGFWEGALARVRIVDYPSAIGFGAFSVPRPNSDSVIHGRSNAPSVQTNSLNG